jgi:hypothetical protein
MGLVGLTCDFAGENLQKIILGLIEIPRIDFFGNFVSKSVRVMHHSLLCSLRDVELAGRMGCHTFPAIPATEW